MFRAGAGREEPGAIRKRIVMTTFRSYRGRTLDARTGRGGPVREVGRRARRGVQEPGPFGIPGPAVVHGGQRRAGQVPGRSQARPLYLSPVSGVVNARVTGCRLRVRRYGLVSEVNRGLLLADEHGFGFAFEVEVRFAAHVNRDAFDGSAGESVWRCAG